MSGRSLGVLAVLAGLALLAGSTALAATPTPASGTTWDANQAVPYRWKAAAEPPAWLKPAINAAAEGSNRTRAARAAVLSYDAGATSWVGYTADIPTSYAVGYAVRDVPNSFTIRLRPHGHVLDWGTLKWCQYWGSLSNAPNGCYDAELITLHEFGHVQTLGHVDESLGEPWLDSVMHAGPRTKAKIGWNEHGFGRCDVARLQIRYRPLTSATPLSTCLDLPTSLTLSPSSITISSGSSVTFTADLTIATSADYAKLQNEPLSQRGVVLQRRLVGTATWTTHGVIPATSADGRYRLTVTPSATHEWRAVFDRPATEGLRGVASSIVRVNVEKCVDGVCCSGSVCVTGGDPATTTKSEEQ